MRPRTVPVSKRGLSLLSLMARCGPLTHRQAERALGAFAPDLLKRRTASRLLYRELQLLTRARFLECRRVLGTNTSSYTTTMRAAPVLEANGISPTEDDVTARYLATPHHEHFVRDVLVEFLRARVVAAGMTGMSWSLTERYPVAREDDPTRYEPDLMLGVQLDGTERTVLVEVDCETESLTVWASKMNKAAAVFGRLPPARRFLIVAEREGRVRSLLASAVQVFGRLAGGLRGVVAANVQAERLLEPVFLMPGSPGPVRLFTQP